MKKALLLFALVAISVVSINAQDNLKCFAFRIVEVYAAVT